MEITTTGPVYDPSGYAEVHRSIALGLQRMGVRVQMRALPWGYARVSLDQQKTQALRQMLQAREVNRGPVLHIGIPPQFQRHDNRYCIGFTMLECDRINPFWVEKCNQMDEVWVPSTFNRETFTRSGVDPAKIVVMPLGVDTSVFHPDVRPMFIPGRKGFTFLSNFEWVPRKGADILLRAYLQEFSAGEDLCLVLKVYHNGPGYDPDGGDIMQEVARIVREVGRRDNPPVILITRILAAGEMPSFYTASNCFVLPSRGEGWGLPLMESMACGRPVITTRWSAPLDFLREDNSFLIDVEGLEPIPPYGTPNDEVYGGAFWARPSLEHLRRLMRRAYHHREEVAARGHKALQDVTRSFTWERVIKRVYDRLATIYRERNPGNPVWAPTKVPPPRVTFPAPKPLPRLVAEKREGLQPVAENGGRVEKAPRPGPSVILPRRRRLVELVVPSWSRPCGVAEYSKALRRGLEEIGHPLRVHNGPLADLLTHPMNTVHFQFEYGLYHPSELQQVAGELARRRVRRILTLHSFSPGASLHNRLLQEDFDCLIVHSEQVARELESLAISRDKIRIIPMGCSRFPVGDRAANRAGLGLGRDEVALGFFGFLYPQKGLKELGLAIRELRRSYPLKGFFFCSVATNPTSAGYHRELNDFYQANGLWEGVSLHPGYFPEAEVVRRLNAMDLNILPYHEYETKGTSAAVRTMMAAGRPVVTTDTSFFSDLQGEVYKIPDPSPERIAAAVSFLLQNPEKQRELVARSKAHLENNSWPRVAARHVVVYQEGAE